MSIAKMTEMTGKVCTCGKRHSFSAKLCTGAGVIEKLPELLLELGGSKAFLLADKNTYEAAGKRACELLGAKNICYSCYVLSNDPVEPDEYAVGSAFMHFDNKCDAIIAVGSGVVHDIGKMLSAVSGKPYIIVATAPSMDGYASATSSMTRDGLKTSLPSRGADVIIGDTDILAQAPMYMMVSGLGDMLAKYVSICEWRIGALITGEYYCEEIAQLIRSAVKTCVAHAEGLLRREKAAVQAVFEGLVIGGVAMNYAGVSRPASGVEHYISHLLDMRGIEFGTPVELHGIQCGTATLLAVRLYEKICKVRPDKEKAVAYAKAFDYSAWSMELRKLVGKGAEAMIALEAKEGKYALPGHMQRLEKILANWDRILQIVEEELPDSAALETLLRTLGAPTAFAEMGIEENLLPAIFQATKDIRDKYVLSRLCWDLGIIEEIF